MAKSENPWLIVVNPRDLGLKITVWLLTWLESMGKDSQYSPFHWAEQATSLAYCQLILSIRSWMGQDSGSWAPRFLSWALWARDRIPSSWARNRKSSPNC